MKDIYKSNTKQIQIIRSQYQHAFTYKHTVILRNHYLNYKSHNIAYDTYTLNPENIFINKICNSGTT